MTTTTMGRRMLHMHQSASFSPISLSMSSLRQPREKTRLVQYAAVSRSMASSPHTVMKKKPRVVILGTGWGGHTLAKRLDKQKFDVRVISPANHFLFTPLLPSTAVGTLEFRAIQEPVRTIDRLGEYYQAKARGLDTDRKVIQCEDLFKKHAFEVRYDYLMVATGNKTNTFNIPGVEEHEGESVLFLKHLYHARLIRNRILECFERASNNNVTKEERSRLLSFVVVGGGPTSCEFTTELYDFIHDDVAKWYPDLKGEIKLTLVEAGDGLLGQFDKSLADYYLKSLRKRGVDVKLSTAVTGVHVKHFEADDSNVKNTDGRPYTVASFEEEEDLPFGMMVWSAGLAPVKFVEDSGLQLAMGRIAVDNYLRVPDQKGRIFAFGDCAIIGGHEGGKGLPPTASIAEQQAYYLSDAFNDYYFKFDPCHPKNDNNDLPLPGPIVPALLPWGGFPSENINRLLTTPSPTFSYKNRGAMAGMGFGGGVSDMTNSDLPFPKVTTSGFAAFLLWRSAYLTKQLSYTNMILSEYI
jgi:NADH dehydrogenase FAD-containing subunit